MQEEKSRNRKKTCKAPKEDKNVNKNVKQGITAISVEYTSPDANIVMFSLAKPLNTFLSTLK
jgi:hypothetical protein